jgi:hypothetical protein
LEACLQGPESEVYGVQTIARISPEWKRGLGFDMVFAL